MMAAELATCHMPEDPTSPIQVGGYVEACMAFHEWGFGVPPHRFLHSLLWVNGLELQHLVPVGILHMAAFVTLCEAYMGIEPPLQSVELLLSCLATIGLRRGNGDFGQCGHLCPI
jgi:hypothetical protein